MSTSTNDGGLPPRAPPTAEEKELMVRGTSLYGGGDTEDGGMPIPASTSAGVERSPTPHPSTETPESVEGEEDDLPLTVFDYAWLSHTALPLPATTSMSTQTFRRYSTPSMGSRMSVLAKTEFATYLQILEAVANKKAGLIPEIASSLEGLFLPEDVEAVSSELAQMEFEMGVSGGPTLASVFYNDDNDSEGRLRILSDLGAGGAGFTIRAIASRTTVPISMASYQFIKLVAGSLDAEHQKEINAVRGSALDATATQVAEMRQDMTSLKDAIASLSGRASNVPVPHPPPAPTVPTPVITSSKYDQESRRLRAEYLAKAPLSAETRKAISGGGKYPKAHEKSILALASQLRLTTTSEIMAREVNA